MGAHNGRGGKIAARSQEAPVMLSMRPCDVRSWNSSKVALLSPKIAIKIAIYIFDFKEDSKVAFKNGLRAGAHCVNFVVILS